MYREIELALHELSDGWVELETHEADFADERLNKRYGRVLGQMSRMPQSPLNQSSENLAEMLGAYRFIDNAKVSVEKLLAPHQEQIARRAAEESTVLLIQDTSYLDFDDHRKLEDLKPLKLKKLHKALWVHATLCLLPNGLPLGIMDAQYMTGKGEGPPVGGTSSKPIEEKLSRRWLDAVDNCQNILGDKIRKIWICDREADIYELMDHIASKGEEYVIRSRFFREIEEEPYYDLRNELEHASISGYFEFILPSNGKRAKRTVKMAVKYIRATLSTPHHKQNVVCSECLPGYVVETFEIDPPEGEDPIHWILLTSLKVDSFKDALQVIGLYQKRWGIEEIFKILKSGCRVEKAQFQNTTRLTKYITLSMIVAWRIYFLVHVNRLDPNAPAETVITTSELETLQLLLDDKRSRKNKQRRLIIRTANQAITQIARLGGYLDRKNDPNPGIVVLWRGTMALAFSTMTLVAQKRAANF